MRRRVMLVDKKTDLSFTSYKFMGYSSIKTLCIAVNLLNVVNYAAAKRCGNKDHAMEAMIGVLRGWAVELDGDPDYESLMQDLENSIR